MVEITGGDPDWSPDAVSAASFLRGGPVAEALNPQMVIDWPPAPGDGAVTRLTISRPVLQRLVDGRSRGLALQALGSLSASFYASDPGAPNLGARLRFDVAGEQLQGRPGPVGAPPGRIGRGRGDRCNCFWPCGSSRRRRRRPRPRPTPRPDEES